MAPEPADALAAHGEMSARRLAEARAITRPHGYELRAALVAEAQVHALLDVAAAIRELGADDSSLRDAVAQLGEIEARLCDLDRTIALARP